MSRKPRGINARFGMSYQSIEDCASRIVNRLVPGHNYGTDQLPAFDVFEALTTSGGNPPFTIPYGRDQAIGLAAAVTPIPDNQHARTRYCEKTRLIWIELSEEAYEWLESGTHPRGPFTFWHEIVHAFLHVNLLVDKQVIEHQTAALARDGATHSFFQDTEWQADAGAAAIIAPLRLLQSMKAAGRLTPVDLAQLTGMSVESASYRIDNATKKQNL